MEAHGTLYGVKRPVALIILGSIILGLLAAGAYWYFAKKAALPDITGTSPTPSIAPKLVLWDDPAGFTVQYPEGLVRNIHEEDKVNYAHVELTDSAHPGSLVIWVKDVPKGVTDTASWAKKAATSSSVLSFDTTLGNQPAQKILVSGATKTITVGVVWDGVLWYIEANLTDEPYWQGVYDTVTNSFAFKPLPTAPGSTSAGSAPSGDTVDEEEVLE